MDAITVPCSNGNPRRRLRVLFVTPRFPPFMGGVEMHTYEVGRRMAADGHKIHVLTGDPNCELPRYEMVDGMEVSRVPVYPKSSDVFFAPSMFARVLRSESDVVHLQGFHGFVPPVAALAAIIRATPFVMTFHSGGHSSRIRNTIRGLQCAALRPLLARANRLIAVSRFEADLFSRRLGMDRARIIVAPNGAQIAQPRKIVPAAPNAPLIVSVGRLERYKGHQRVIQAFAEVLKRRPLAKLRICGEGSYRDRLQTLVATLGLQHSVCIRGISATSRGEMSTLLASASLVTLLSDYEAHPVAALEAIALGRPVLASNTTGFAEMVASGLVFGVDPDADSYLHASAMLAALDNNAARNPPTDLLLTWDECARNLIDIYLGVLRDCREARSAKSFASA